MIKAIIFDFFGVVGQSTYQLVAEDYNYTKEQIQELSDLHKAFNNEFITDEEFLKTYAQIIGAEYSDFIEKYYKSEQRFSSSYKVLALVEELKKQYQVALLSNVGADGYSRFIEPIEHHFNVVVTSHESKLAKPDRAIYEYTADKLGLDVSECLMIDDSATNCQGAEFAGMQSLQFTDIADCRKRLEKILADSNN